MKKLSDIEIFNIVDEKLGWRVLKIDRIPKRIYVTLIDQFEYYYDKIEIQSIKQDHKPNFIYTSNSYSLQNIKLWCKLNNKPFDVISKIYLDSKTNLQWKCLKNNCGEIFEASWNDINSDRGCPYCAGKKVGISNCLATKYPDIAKEWHLTKNGNLTPYYVTCGINKDVWWQCPDCGYEYSTFIVNKIKLNIKCPICSDGVSYPNKFIRCILNQLNLDFEIEKMFDWSKDVVYKNKFYGNKIYDNYIETNNCIIEVHGLNHYKGGFETLKGKTLKEEIENDKIKEKIAKNNGIKYYIVIDARVSDLEYIKNSVLNSKLNELFNLSNIDWLKCHEFALSNLVRAVCELWENGIRSTKEISKMTKMSRTTITTYLKQGAQLGWCNYNPKEIIVKKVIQLTLNKEFIKEWDSIRDIEKQLGLNHSNISACCLGKRNHVNRFKWMYKEDYYNYMKEVVND